MFYLVDTFNRDIRSRHRTEEAARAEAEKLNKAVRKHCGSNAYIPTCIFECKEKLKLGYDHYWDKTEGIRIV